MVKQYEDMEPVPEREKLAEVYVRVEYAGQVHETDLRCSDSLSGTFVQSLLTEAAEQIRARLNRAQVDKWKSAERAETSRLGSEVESDAPPLPAPPLVVPAEQPVPEHWTWTTNEGRLPTKWCGRGDKGHLAHGWGRGRTSWWCKGYPPSTRDRHSKRCRAVVIRAFPSGDRRTTCGATLDTDGVCPVRADHATPEQLKAYDAEGDDPLQRHFMGTDEFPL